MKIFGHRVEKNNNQYGTLVLVTSHGEKTIADLCEYLIVANSTVRRWWQQGVLEERFSEYEKTREDRVMSAPLPDWDRTKCKRDGICCASYADCQAKRIGLAGAGKWVEPGNTDSCYIGVPMRAAGQNPDHFFNARIAW